MPTVNAGSVASIHCPLDSTITVTPGATAKVSVQSVSSPSFLAATITDAKTLPVTAGDLVIITAIDADVTYTEPALSAAQVAAVAFASIAAADIQTTEGAALGESREIADGDDAGARLIWRVPQGQTEPAWCWWLWPQSQYEGA